MKLKKALFSDILSQYKRFFVYDVEFSLLCGRNFVYLETLRGLLYLVVTDNLNEDKIDDDKFSKIKSDITQLYKAIQSTCIDELKSNKIEIHSHSAFVNILDTIFNDVIKNIKIYLIIYEMLYKQEAKKHEGMLIELNNAFSHILTYGLSSTTDNNHNLKKANDHLVRGILDGLKALILLNINTIKSDENLLKELI